MHIFLNKLRNFLRNFLRNKKSVKKYFKNEIAKNKKNDFQNIK